MPYSRTENLIRRNCIPIIYTKGTHYEVGFDVGRTFAAIIQNFLNNAECLPDYIEAFNSLEGKIGYESTLNNLKENFPQYIEELEGTADGANVPFYKLFLLHMDNIILSANTSLSSSASRINLHQPTGCSTICVNEKGQEFIGHTEDALAATLNHFYFVSAHIIETEPRGKWAVKEEKFTSLCYAGHLPGYTMSYNHHGLVYSINTLCAKDLRPGKTPRHFLARALLGAENFVTAQQILRDSGTGAGDGCSINLTFLKQDGNRMIHNIEMGPCSEENFNESQLNVLTISSGEFIMHTNSYLRLKIEEANPVMTESSVQRLKTFQQYKEPRNEEDIKKMLSDKSNCVHSVFRDKNEDFVQTICVGIFNLTRKTWSLYADAPTDNDPLVVLPLQLKD